MRLNRDGTIMKKVLIIIGSVRPKRVGPQIAEWLADLAAIRAEATFEIVDLKDWSLPMDDEPHQPKRLDCPDYAQSHTLDFSRLITSADGFILVSPQYNWGYPAALKNALDHLYYEWSGKPVGIVSYGARGGAKAAAQLREVVTGLGMTPVEPFPALALRGLDMDDDLLVRDPAAGFEKDRAVVMEALESLCGALTGEAVA